MKCCCTQCDFVTKFKSNLNRHVKSKHPPEKQQQTVVLPTINATKLVEGNNKTLQVQPKVKAKTVDTNNSREKIGYIYLCIPEYFQMYNEPVYKVGMTIQVPSSIISRITNYGPNTEILLLKKVHDKDMTLYAEELILREFRKEFKIAQGREFFYGNDPEKMADIIVSTLRQLKDNQYDKYDYQTFKKQYSDPLEEFGFGMCVLLGYVDYKALRRSLKEHKPNKPKPEDPNKEKPCIKCTKCGTTFLRMRNLKVHIDKGRCRGVLPTQCQYCKCMLGTIGSRYDHEHRCKRKQQFNELHKEQEDVDKVPDIHCEDDNKIKEKAMIVDLIKAISSITNVQNVNITFQRQ